MNPAITIPGKDPRQLVRDPEGLNTGPPPGLLGAQLVTPASLFFTRSHAPTPVVDAAAWRLRLGGLVRRPMEWSLEQLRQRFPQREVTATLVCAGLRRDELVAHRPVPGELLWGPEPISTGHWSGVALRDLLHQAEPLPDATDVGFVGLDQVERHGRRFGFGGSVPLAKATGSEVLIAFQLNGQPLPPEHGFPARVVVPGYIGARSVKWLAEIQVLDEPSRNYFQTEAYRVLREPDPANPRDVSAGEALGAVPLNAVILSPEAGARVPAGEVRLTGWAMASGGNELSAVEVSGDGGGTWAPATITAEAGPWAWRLWNATLRLGTGKHVLVVRARDTGGEAQPEQLAEVWNVKGYGNNVRHRVEVEVGP